MEHGNGRKFVKEEVKRWLVNLVSSLRILPKRSDSPPEPHHPDESVD